MTAILAAFIQAMLKAVFLGIMAFIGIHIGKYFRTKKDAKSEQK